jgi:heterodisulfide reductase subunit C/nitrate reductase gamma subunit
MRHPVALWIALAVFAAGLAVRGSAWFRNGFGAGARGTSAAARLAAAARGIARALLSGRIRTIGRSFVHDVLLQRRIRSLCATRWLAHELMFVAFVALLLMHALGSVLTARLFPSYQPTLDPFLFLRDLFGAVLLAGLAIATYRRFFVAVPRRETRPSDSYALAIVALILVSGVLLEAVKIGSYARFQSMVREYASEADEAPLAAHWAREMGTVAPAASASPALAARGRELHEQSCAACHSRPQSAFVGYVAATLLRPVSPRLDAIGAPRILWLVHFYACLAGLALVPFTKMFHLFATPLSLVVNAVVARGKPAPENVATKQMIELDACTHCCTCSARCSMAMASGAVQNETVLPSEKISALRALASGRDLAPLEVRTLQEGVCLCTGCDRCTVSCPSGIDLLGLWRSAREALLAKGEPEFALLSPLSLRRRLLAPELGPAGYREPVERPRRAIAAHFGFAALADRSSPLAPGDDRPWSALRRSLQASTVAGCFGCKSCSTACPVVRTLEDPQKALGLLPHQVLYAARLRLWDLVLGSNMLWDCLGCYQCQEHCPQRVGVTDVLYELKNVAIAQVAAARRDETEARP